MAPHPGHSSPATSSRSGYSELTREIRAAGLLRPRPGSYAAHAALVLGALAAVVAVMAIWRDSWWLLFVAPVMAVVTTQINFLGHDVCHRQVTASPGRSRLLGLVVGNLMGGLSYGWWVRKHNAHHAHPNDLATDPDVRDGILVFDATQATGKRGVGAFTVRHQALFFFPFLVAEALNLHVASFKELAYPQLRNRAVEGVLLVAHFAAYGALLVSSLTWLQVLCFFAIHKSLQGLYLGCSFAPGHKGMPTLTPAQAADPLLRQVLTSRNIRSSRLIDTALGGLNFQIEHHLFPSMARSNLRRAQPIVQRFCAAHDIPYVECSAWASYSRALRHLHTVGAALRR
jgi:fatty acid desaturase